MTEWGVVGVIIALVGLVAVLVKPMISLTQIITKLGASVDSLSEKLETTNGGLEELTQRNADSHARIFDKLDDHEIRITKLESK